MPRRSPKRKPTQPTSDLESALRMLRRLKVARFAWPDGTQVEFQRPAPKDQDTDVVGFRVGQAEDDDEDEE